MEVDTLVRDYITLRDEKDALKKKYEAAVALVEEPMTAIENKLLDLARETGVDSFKTASGTAYRSVKTRYWASDWDEFKRFVLERGDLDMLEHRIHQSNFRAFIDENPEAAPPVEVDARYTMTFRRPTK